MASQNSGSSGSGSSGPGPAAQEIDCGTELGLEMRISSLSAAVYDAITQANKLIGTVDFIDSNDAKNMCGMLCAQYMAAQQQIQYARDRANDTPAEKAIGGAIADVERAHRRLRKACVEAAALVGIDPTYMLA
jgi:hypothetical protein